MNAELNPKHHSDDVPELVLYTRLIMCDLITFINDQFLGMLLEMDILVCETTMASSTCLELIIFISVKFSGCLPSAFSLAPVCLPNSTVCALLLTLSPMPEIAK